MNILMGALQPGGGIRTFFRYIYGQPDFDRCTFTLVAPDHGLGEYLDEFLPPERIKLIPTQPDSVKYISRIRNIVRKERFDLVHSHGFTAGALTEVAIIGRKIPHLMTGHDMFTDPLFSGARGKLKHFLLAVLLQRITAIHTVTEDAKSNMLEFFPGISEQSIFPILHGIDTEFFGSGESYDLKAQIGLSPDVPLIGFFGRFMSPKGFRSVVEALDYIRRQFGVQALPHVATFGWGGFIREDYAYLQDLGLADYFHQLPQTNNMPSALRSVDLVVMPSRWEACGLLAMECLTAGVPIIGSDCIGLREVLDGSPAVTVPVGDAEKLGVAILKDLADLKRRREQFTEYQPIAAERFEVKRPARELLQLYKKINNSR
ncbi:glycosyltransferase family 4 protein [Marinobacter pelagius]|uniref:Glycosyltransferase involved in cell wall bisynthesis n=1 Tax=Marinobacter pelagius TaxID=379482 RepID=A0A1I4SZ92_9GAMM|nr:glycosyltransferase family 4 protein [Marinobacter pelagius]SFM69838.1 Glycosyltransferase involved in cell wall bisynthesis [Marinobacter pelagius]